MMINIQDVTFGRKRRRKKSDIWLTVFTVLLWTGVIALAVKAV